MKDEDLLRMLREGRLERAFTRLYRQLPDVTAHVRANSGSRQDALDIFQDGLVILHERALDPSFQPTGSIAGFLYATCRNLWYAELRLRGRAVRTANEPLNLDPTSDGLELRHRLAEAAFAKLGNTCRELLERFYLRGEHLVDVARSLGLAGEGAAKTRKYKCLEQARAHYRTLNSTVTQH